MSHGIPFILLLQLLFGAVVTGTEKMSALSGTCFTLFSNLASHERISLYRNGKENQAIIARINSSTLHFEILNPNYTEKIFLAMNIKLCNLNQTHSAKYIVQYGYNTTGPVKELLIMESSEDQVHTWLKDHPDFMDKYLEKILPEQMPPCNQSKEVLKESSDRYNQLFIGLLILISIIVILLIGVIYMYRRLRANKLSEDQVHKWLNDHPDYMDTYLGKLTEDQLRLQIQKWKDAYPGLFKNKALDEVGNDCQEVTPTLDQQPVPESGIEIESNQTLMISERDTSFASLFSDKRDKAKILTTSKDNEHSKWSVSGTGNEDNHEKLELPIKWNSSSSATVSVPGPSGIQPFNKDKQDANPAQDTEQDVRVDIEDSDSEDKCQEPLMAENPELEDNIPEKRGAVK